jgi:hypothetical protein
MKVKTIKALKIHLKQDNAFFDIYLIELRKQINKSYQLLSNILFESFSLKDDKQVKQAFDKFVDSFIDGMYFDNILSYYLLKEKFVDVAWFKVDDDIVNLDDLFIDFQSYCQG